MNTTYVGLFDLAMLSLWIQHMLGYLLLICCLYGYNICWVICSCYAIFMDTTSVGLCALAMLSLWIQHLLGYLLLICCLYRYNICLVMCSCYAVFMDTTSVGLCALAMLSFGYNVCWVMCSCCNALFHISGRKRSGTLDKFFRRRSGRNQSGRIIYCTDS